MPLGGAIAGGVAALASGVIGAITGANAQAAAKQAAQQALEQIQAVGAPPDLAQKILLEKFKSAGVLTPEVEHAINLGPSQVAGIKTDQGLKDKQLQALELIQQRANGGLSPQDRANLDDIRQNAAQDTRAKTDQILQSYQQKGMGGSGAALAAQLSAAQAGNQEQSRAGLQQGAIASQNALSALGQLGSLSGQVRGQDFGENQARAQAADAFSQFNVANQIAQQARNVNSKNQAQAANLQNDQNISNANTSAGNAELQRQVAAQHQMWQDQMTAAQSKANALNGQATQARQEAQNTAQSWQNIGAGVAGAAGAIGNAFPKTQAMISGGQPPAIVNQKKLLESPTDSYNPLPATTY